MQHALQLRHSLNVAEKAHEIKVDSLHFDLRQCVILHPN